MELGEKMSYLQGLLDGLEIDRTTKEGKLLVQVIEVMREMSDTIDDLQSQVDELTELCDVLDEDLGEVEETLLDCCEKDHHHHHGHGHCCCHDDDDEDDDFDYDDFDYDDENYEDFDYDDDDELYEVCCPICDETIVLDETMLDEGSIECPCCGELLEFDFLGDDDDSEDEPENGEQEQEQ